MNSLQTIGVIGIGTMGRGSAQIGAHAGLSVSMPDVDEQRVTHGHVEAAAALAKRLGKPPVVKDWRGFAMNRVLGRDTRSTSLCSSAIRIDREIVRLAVVCQDVLRGWLPA
jgi:3-hydroxyacyl-CoA dehydrogenase